MQHLISERLYACRKRLGGFQGGMKNRACIPKPRSWIGATHTSLGTSCLVHSAQKGFSTFPIAGLSIGIVPMYPDSRCSMKIFWGLSQNIQGLESKVLNILFLIQCAPSIPADSVSCLRKQISQFFNLLEPLHV